MVKKYKYEFNLFVVDVFDILASSLEMLHTDCIRKLNGGQYLLSILLSAETGKSQGKSSIGQVLYWSISDNFGQTIDSSVDKMQ